MKAMGDEEEVTYSEKETLNYLGYQFKSET